MDVTSGRNLGESFQPSTLDDIRDDIAVNTSSMHVLSTTCALCHSFLSLDSETGDLEAIGICGDCKFLLMEDLETTSPDVYERRRHASRRRQGSSESIESIFSQQLSQMILLARQNQLTALEHDNQSVEGDGAAARLVHHHASSRTTPSGSRRWRRVFSDTESDGIDSLYGESESNMSFRRYRPFYGESDTISYSAYGGDSDASIDGRSYLEQENFGHPDGVSDLDSDTDIDPMNAGFYQWNSEDEDDSEQEEADTTERSSRRVVYFNRQRLYPEVEGTTLSFRIQGRMQAHTSDLFPNDDYLDAAGFNNLLEHLAEADSSSGPPPASVSFVNNIPRMTINEDHEKVEDLTCAICKDALTFGIVVNQLPCFHLYHPSCILPWLSARNTCPLCRFELPTDDKEYEERKRRSRGSGHETLHIRGRHDSSSSTAAAHGDTVAGEPSQLHHHGRAPRNSWFFIAAPIASIIGISLMLWLGNSSADRRCRSARIPYDRQNSQTRRTGWSLW